MQKVRTYVHQYLADDVRTYGAVASLQLATQGYRHGRSRGRTASVHVYVWLQSPILRVQGADR